MSEKVKAVTVVRVYLTEGQKQMEQLIKRLQNTACVKHSKADTKTRPLHLLVS
ncbi:MAG: hypothetical protein P8Y20_03460 [Gammaproteobacteria bacterium]